LELNIFNINSDLVLKHSVFCCPVSDQAFQLLSFSKSHDITKSIVTKPFT